jgi:hypothetical protein
MNDLQRIDLQDLVIKTRASSARTSRKVAIGLLAILIVSAMISWFGFLGWGAFGILQWLGGCIKHFWTAYL